MPHSNWHRSRSKPANTCRYIKDIGLCTVFPYGGGYKLVGAGQFYGPFATQEEAQLAVKNLTISASAEVDDQEESNVADTAAVQATEAQRYASKAQFDKLVEYVQALAREHNSLEEHVKKLEGEREALVGRVEALESRLDVAFGEQVLLQGTRELERVGQLEREAQARGKGA